MTGARDIPGVLVPAATRLRDAAAALEPAIAGPPVAAIVALGLATVDAERAMADAGDGPWEVLPRDSLLGATVRRRPLRVGAANAPEVLLLEPDTEGRLAASLARFGEGLAVVYVRPARAPIRGEWRSGAGPLGRSHLLPGPSWGPFVVVLDPAATIEP